MYILVAPDGFLALQDSDNMRAFSIVLGSPDADLNELAKIGVLADDKDHYWLEVDAVEELSARIHDQQWLQGFRAMLVSVAPYGYYDKATNKLKAHVEKTDA
jgi:hypothetical protein